VPDELCGLFESGKLSYCDISTNQFACPLPSCVKKETGGNDKCAGECV